MGRPVKDLTGQIFGRLTVLRLVGIKSKSAVWECRCTCGLIVNVFSNNLRSGTSRSCGCLSSERTVLMNFKHGKTGTPIFKTWGNIRSRCNNPKDISYKYYGGRGIKVCQRWNESFEAFYADMGDPPPGSWIDRINNNGDYEPSNCKWSTPKEQANNRRKRPKKEGKPQ